MKNSILNLGKALNKAEQKEINGGSAIFCNSSADCCSGFYCEQSICVSSGSSGGGDDTPGDDGTCQFIKILCEYEGDTCCLY